MKLNLLKILKSVFTLLLIVAVSCSKTVKTDIGKVARQDVKCLKEIKRAKKDFEAGKEFYFVFTTFGNNQFNEDFENNLKKAGIAVKKAWESDVFLENERQNCYQYEMNFLVTQEKGPSKVQEIYAISKSGYFERKSLKLTEYSEKSGEMMVAILDEKDLLSYPKRYQKRSALEDISYIETNFKIINAKIENLSVSYINEANSASYYNANWQYAYDLEMQIRKKLPIAVEKQKIADGSYSLVILLK